MTLYFMTQGTNWDNNIKTKIMIRTLTGCVIKLWEGLLAPSFNIITNNTTVAFESSIFEGVLVIMPFFNWNWVGACRGRRVGPRLLMG